MSALPQHDPRTASPVDDATIDLRTHEAAAGSHAVPGGSATRFPVVLRGYDKRHVDEYSDWAEQRIADGERNEAEDADRITALETHLEAVRVQLVDAEERASGLPEPASRIGARLTEMLRLAEQEAEQIVEQARERALASTAERAAELERRETAAAGAEVEADRVRLEAQRDAEALRERANAYARDLTQTSQAQAQSLLDGAHADAEATLREAQDRAEATMRLAQEQSDELHEQAEEFGERMRKQADEDVAIIHADSRATMQQRLAEAQREVEELAVQRDTIADQLARLQDQLAVLVQPLGGSRTA